MIRFCVLKKMAGKTFAVLLGAILGFELLILACIGFSLLPVIIQTALVAAGMGSLLICLTWMVVSEAKFSYYRACRECEEKEGN